jgi:hypothetical protein
VPVTRNNSNTVADAAKAEAAATATATASPPPLQFPHLCLCPFLALTVGCAFLTVLQLLLASSFSSSSSSSSLRPFQERLQAWQFETSGRCPLHHSPQRFLTNTAEDQSDD